MVRYDSSAATGCIALKSSSFPSSLSDMRVSSSATMTRSRMMGAARSESSQVLCMTMVDLPPWRKC